jgi:hypothetical protein
MQTVIDVSGKEIEIEHVEGPVGVHARNFKQRNVAQVQDQILGLGGRDKPARRDWANLRLD